MKAPTIPSVVLIFLGNIVRLQAVDLRAWNKITTIPTSYFQVATQNILRCEKMCERQGNCAAVTFDSQARICYMHDADVPTIQASSTGHYMYKVHRHKRVPKSSCDKDTEIVLETAQKEGEHCLDIRGADTTEMTTTMRVTESTTAGTMPIATTTTTTTSTTAMETTKAKTPMSTTTTATTAMETTTAVTPMSSTAATTPMSTTTKATTPMAKTTATTATAPITTTSATSRATTTTTATTTLIDTTTTTPVEMTAAQSASTTAPSNFGLGDITCSSVNECGGVDHSECRQDGNCGCLAGYSYQQSTDTCELKCVVYGNSFQSFPGKVLWDNYALYQEGGYTEESCRQACLCAAYTCVTFDFTTAYNGCYHHVDDSIDRPDEYQNYGTFTHFQRNCA